MIESRHDGGSFLLDDNSLGVSAGVSLPPRDVLVTTDVRLEQLESWLTRLFGARDFEVRPASADASFRRYFRVTRDGRTFIAMDAPPDKEDLGPYVHVAQMLADIGVNAPRVLHRNDAEGYLLLTDLGARTYLAELQSGGDAERLYLDAIDALVKIQAGGAQHASELPPYDEALLRREIALFPEWFCGRHLGLEPERAGLEKVYDALVAEALAQPRVFVHRDYHSRNLMVGDGERFGPNPGILDFQDAVYGPLTYDLVSLLRDCYIAWPSDRVERWLAHFHERAQRAGVPVHAERSELRRAFDLMGVQRHLKAIGIFARLWHRDGKPGYLNDIPRTLAYVKDVSARYTELTPLRRWVDDAVEPALSRLATQAQG
jgi:aminoglycoside/choline kinase family phosphotransferase